jgi:hypothetical protein
MLSSLNLSHVILLVISDALVAVVLFVSRRIFKRLVIYSLGIRNIILKPQSRFTAILIWREGESERERD